MTATLPGQANPFKIGSSFLIGLVGRYEVKIKGYNLVSAQSYVSPTVTFASETSSGYIVGTIRNTSPFTIANTRVVLNFKVASCGVNIYDFPEKLKPAQTITFIP